MLRLLALLAGLLMVPVALVALVLAALQSEAVRVAALDAVNRFVPGVVVEGLGPGLPARLSLDRIALADDDGVWLDARALSLAWRPAALLTGQVQVDHLTVAELTVERAPAAGAAAAPEAPPEPTPPEPFALPSTLFPVTVDRLAIERLALGAPLLGEAAAFAVDGSVDAGGPEATAKLALRRLDAAGLTADLAVDLDLAGATLAVDLQAREASGLIAGLAGEPRVEPLVVRLQGTGPLDGWSGALAAEVGTLASLSADLGLALREPLRVTLDGRVEPGSELAATAYAPLLEDGLAFALAVDTGAEGINLERLTASAPWLDLAAGGSLVEERVQATLGVEVPDLAPLSAVAGQDLAGAVRLAAELGGDLPLPAGQIHLNVEELATAGVAVARLDPRLDVTPRDDGGVAFALTGGVEALRLTSGAADFEESLTLDATGSVMPGGPFALERLAIDGRTLALTGTAAGDLGAGTADADLQLRLPDLAAFRSLSPAAPLGAFVVDVRAALTDGFQAGRVELEARGDDLAELPAPAGALLGPSPNLRLAARLAPLPVVEVERLALEATNLDLAGTGRIDTAALAGSVDLTGRVPDLAPVGAALGQPLAGRVTLDLSGDGTADDFATRLGVDVAGLVANDQAFETVGLALTAEGAVSDVEGRLEAQAAKGDGTLRLAADYRATPERLRLAALDLRAPGLRLGGELDLGLQPLAADGRLSGGSDGLAALGRWLGVPLAGTADVDIGMASTDGQSATAAAKVRGLDVMGIALRRLDVRADARDLLGTPALDASVELGGLVQGTTTVDDATVTAAGDLARLDVALAANGTLPDPFEVTGGAAIAQKNGVLEATLQSLQGKLADVPVRLLQPATVRVEGADIALDGLTLEIDTARLQTRAALGSSRVDAALDLAGLELSTLERFGVPPLDGRVDAALRLTGSKAAPVLAGEVGLTGLSQPESDVEPIAVMAELDLAGGVLDTVVTTEGLGDPPLRAAVQVPVRFALEPFAFALPDPLPLDAALGGSVDLARLALWYGLDGQEVAGRLLADLAVGGTVVNPALDGDLRLVDVRVVDVAAGVLVEQLALTLQAEGQRLNLARLSATDGADGRLSGGGGVMFGGEAGVDFDLEAALDRFSVVQREDLFIEMSGRTEVTGAGGDIDVLGRFTVNRGEIFIPKGGGAASFPTLDVVTAEEARARAEAEAATGGAPAGLVTLDVQVDIPSRLFVRGAGVVSEWGGTVTVEGDASAPTIAGLIEYRRGYADILDNRFQFRKGEIRLTGVWPPDPFIDIEAVAEAGDLSAVLNVEGPVLDPELSLTSEPPGPEDEVLAQLLFDRSNAELNSIQAIKLAAALDQLRGGGQGFLDTLRSGLGLDTLELGGEDLDTASVRAGTYVSEDVFLELEQGLQAGSGAARVEVELTPRIKLETRVSEDQTGSVGLRWSYDY